MVSKTMETCFRKAVGFILLSLTAGCEKIYYPAAHLLLPPPSLYARPATWEVALSGGGQIGKGYYPGERYQAVKSEAVLSRGGEAVSFRTGMGAFSGRYSFASTQESLSSYGGRIFLEGELHTLRKPSVFLFSIGMYFQLSREGGEYLERFCNSAFCPETNILERTEGGTRRHSNSFTPWILGKTSLAYTGKEGEDLFRLDLYLPFYPFYLIPFTHFFFPVPFPGIYPLLTFRLSSWFSLSAGYPFFHQAGGVLFSF